MLQYSPPSIKPVGKLITRYVHSANPVIQPTALDTTTGIFTTATPHGLSVGDNLIFVFNSNNISMTAVPYEWATIGSGSNTQLQVNTIVSSTQFTLKQGTNLWTSYPSANNTALDCTQYHFESVQGVSGITLAGFQSTALNVKIRGFVSDGDCYLSNNQIRTKSWQSGPSTSVFSSGWAMSSNATHVCWRYINMDAYLWLGKDGRIHLRGDLKQMKISTTRTIADATPTTTQQYAISLSQITDNYFSDITFGNSQCLANNAVIELYDIS